MKVLRTLAGIVQGEPVVVGQLIAAVVTLLAAFGLQLPTGADVAIGAILSIVAGLIARSQVTPVSGLAGPGGAEPSDASVTPAS